MGSVEDVDMDSVGTVLFRVRRLLHSSRYDLLGARGPAKGLLAATQLRRRPWLMVDELWECGRLPSVRVIQPLCFEQSSLSL